jgi:hypothetical protein
VDGLGQDDQSPDGIIDFGDLTHSWSIGELAVTVSAVLRHEGGEPAATLPLIAAFHQVRPLRDSGSPPCGRWWCCGRPPWWSAAISRPPSTPTTSTPPSPRVRMADLRTGDLRAE